tara:strand:- start:1739 stop:1960 length:222 start_codon:yes stop_codon:yes gene_type:complete
MTFDQAIAKSIKTFLDGKMPEKLIEVSEGELKYTPEYLDQYEQELAEESSNKAYKKKIGKKKKEMEKLKDEVQ